MHFRNSIFGLLALILAPIIVHTLKETAWAIFVEGLLEDAAHRLGTGKPELMAYVFQIIIVAVPLWAALAFAHRWGLRDRLEDKTPKYGLFVELVSILPGRKIQAHSRAFWLDLVHPDVEFALAIHSSVFSGDSNVTNDINETVYLASVTNYGKFPVSNVDLMLILRYQNAVKQADGVSLQGAGEVTQISKSVRILKIDPGPENPFTFFVRNLTTGFVQLALEDTATLQRLGEQALYKVRVTSPLTERSAIFRPRE